MRKLKIAYGSSRTAKKWSNKSVTFDELCEQFRTPVRTAETVEEYPRLPKAERDRIKDIGGIVPAELRDGRRKGANVICCSMVKLDGDKVEPSFLDTFELINPYAAVVYSTHSHTPESPRLRIFVPTTRDMTSEETVAVTRFYADSLGIDQFDECSYLPHQLMYRPSAPSNGEYIFRCYEGDVKEAASKEQNAALETDPREGMVREYLDRLLPDSWRDMDIYRRREFIHGDDDPTQPNGTVRRDTVCPMEIWAECYGKDPAAIKKADSYEIGAVLRKLGWVSNETRRQIPIYGQQRLWERDKV